MDQSIGKLSLELTLDSSTLSEQVKQEWKRAQTYADAHTIKYSFTGDKGDLERIQKQIQGLRPNIQTGFQINLDKQDFENKLNLLRSSAGKEADAIGKDFSAHINNSMKGIKVENLLSGKNLFNSNDATEELKTLARKLSTETKNFKIGDAQSFNEVENYVTSLKKLEMVLKELEGRGITDIKSASAKKSMDLSSILSGTTSQIKTVMGDVGSVIKTNASSWATILETTFQAEFGNILQWVSQMQNAINGVLGGTGGDNGLSKELEEVNAKIQETTSKLEEAKKKLADLKNGTAVSSSPIDLSNVEKFKSDFYADMNKWNNSSNDIKEMDRIAKSLAERAKAWKDAGNDLKSLFVDNKQDSRGNKVGYRSVMHEWYKDYIQSTEKKIKPTTTNVVDTKAIEAQQKVVDNLATSLQNLAERKQDLTKTMAANGGTGAGIAPTGGTGTGGTGTGTGTNVPTNANVSPILSEDFKTRLQEQVTGIGSVDATISGKLSETFKSDVQTNVSSLGSVEMGVKFAQSSKEGQNTQEIPVNVTAKPVLSDTFRNDLQSQISSTGQYEISVSPKDGEQNKSVPIKATIENGEEFKTQLKQIVEGANGLDIKVNPVVDAGFNLEIKNATLKGVTVEGDIVGGNVKPASIETPTANADTGEGGTQEKVQGNLDKIKQKHQEVGNAAVESGEKQKRSLLEVAKEIERVEAEQQKLMALEDSAASSSGMKGFIQQKKQQAAEYVHVQELVAKIQSKMAEGTSKSASTSDITKHYAGIVAYVERLKELMGSAFSYDVLGENGEAKFNNMKNIIEQVSGATGDNIQKIREFNKELTRLNSEKVSLEATASSAEKLELELYNLVKSVEQLKAHGKNNDLINVNSKSFNEFFSKWKEYKSSGGTKNITEFTSEAKVIHSVNKAYQTYIENQKLAQAEIQKKAAAAASAAAKEEKALQRQVETIKASLSQKFPTVDLAQFTSVFDEVLSKKKSYTDAFAEIRASILSMQSATKGGVGSTSAVVSNENAAKPVKVDASGEINVVPKVENPGEFANQVTGQLKGVSAEINVKPNLELANNINAEIGGHDNLQQEIEETKSKERERYENALALLQQYLSLQDKIASGNAKILPPKASDAWSKENVSWLINSNDTTRQSKYTKVTQASLKRLIESYDRTTNETDKNQLVDKIAAYTHALQDASKAESVFGNKHKALFQEVVNRIEQAKVAAEALKTAGMDRNGILGSLKDSGLEKIAPNQFDKFFNIAKIDGVENAFQYLTEELNYKIPAAANKAKAAINGIGEQTKQEGQEVKSAVIQIPVDANIDTLNASIQSKKDQILPVEIAVKVDQTTLEQLKTLDTELDKIVVKFQKLTDNPLKVNVDYSSIEQLFKADKNGVSTIDTLKTSIDGLQTGILKDLTTSLSGLNVKDGVAAKIKELADALNIFKGVLNNVSPDGSGFLNTINDLASKSKALENLATVIKATKQEIQKAKNEINNASSGSGTKSTSSSQASEKEKYTILKETLREVLRLTKEYNKEKNQETKNGLASQIKLYQDRADTLQLELWELEKINEVEQNRVSIIQEQINLENQKSSNKETAKMASQNAMAEELNKKLIEQEIILAKDSNEWENALRLLYWYKDGLNDIVKITRNINLDPNTGFKAISYQFTDSQGSTKTVGANGDLLIDNSKVADLNVLYSKLKASANEYYALQTKIINGKSSAKVETDALFAYNNMVAAQKEITYWKEKGLVPSREQLQIEEQLASISTTLKDTEKQSGLNNMYQTVLGTIERLNAKQKEVNELKLKADGTTEFAESIKNAQNNVSTLIATLRGFKFGDFFTTDALSALNLHGGSFLFDNNDLNSFKWVINQLPLTEQQIQSISDALDKNTLIKEQNAAAQNKINHAEQQKNQTERINLANENLQMIVDSLNKQYDLTNKIIQLEKSGRSEEAKLVNAQLVEEIRNCDALVAGYKTYSDVINDVHANLQKVFSNSKEKFNLLNASSTDSAATDNIKNISSAYRELIKNEETYQKLVAKQNAGTATQEQIQQLEQLTLSRQRAQEIIGSVPAGYQLSSKELALQEQYNLVLSQVNSKKEIFANNEKEIQSLLQRTSSLLDQFANKQGIEGFSSVFERAKTQIDELNRKLQEGSIKNLQTGYVDKVNGIMAGLKDVVAVVDPGSENSLKMAQQTMLQYAQTLNNGNVKIGEFTNNGRRLNVELETQRGVVEKVALEYNHLDGAIRQVAMGSKKSTSLLGSFLDGLKQRARSMVQYLMTYASFYRIIYIIRDGVNSIKELDKALTEMRKVSDESIKSLKEFQKVSFDIANTVGTTGQQLQKSTADFMRLGESMDEAIKSAKVANTLLNVSEFEGIDEATDSLIAMSSAYNELTKTDIIDKLNEVGNNYAISTDGIATALQKSASALKTASNDMDEAIALVTAGNAVVQDPDSVGSGLRTIALRLTGTKAAAQELEDLGEDTEGVIKTVSKLRETIMSATAVASNGFKGFDILDKNGNYKSTYEILKGISEIYQEIVETDEKNGTNNKNLLLETIAGKNRSNIAASILQNPELLESVYDSSANDSEGSAQEELDKSLDSIEGKMQQFKNEVQEFWYGLISSDTVKTVIGSVATILDVIGKLTSGIQSVTGDIGVLGVALAGAFSFHALKSGGRSKELC